MKTRRGVAAAVAVVLTSCGGRLSSPTAPSAGATTEILVGAGDISLCGAPGTAATALLLDATPGTVFTAGDNVQDVGAVEEYTKCYALTWGRHRDRTRPSPGNHDYYTSGAAGYFAYFGDKAGPPGVGYYSYNLGAWHILSLNSNVPAGAGSVQAAWLIQDLARNRSACTLAYWHHPVFSSGFEGNMPNMRYLWGVLYEARAEVVIVGHSHDYERFAPQNAAGVSDPERGIREFVVGTGGAFFTGQESRKANSEVFNNQTFGVLKLTLSSGGYEWAFVPVAGGTFTDAGSGVCF